MLDRLAHFAAGVTSLALLLLGVVGCTTTASSQAPVVMTDQGKLSGLSFLDDGATFFGVPFAAAPVGEKRWTSPAPPEPWSGSRSAETFAPACPQGDYTTAWYADVISQFGGDPADAAKPNGESEDCLYLNIWTPDLSPDTDLPVMVWIHGGAYKGGWSYEPNYLGVELAKRGVIVVSVAYRLGPFGYIGPGGDANFGLEDQIAALEWVQSNIEQFGGDQERITVFGESAGASSIGTLILSPSASGLFQRAIHQSGGFEFIEEGTKATAAAAFDKLKTALGTDDPRTASWQDVLNASNDVLSGYWFAPVAGGNGLPQSPKVLLDSGQLNPVDLMIGTNGDEWLMYIDAEEADGEIEKWRNRLPEAGEITDSLIDQFGPVGALDRIETADQMRCPGRSLSRALTANGRDVFAYRFSRVRSEPKDLQIGSYHGAEIPYVFGTHDDWLPMDETDRQITETMMSAWTAFAITGSPQAVVDWPTYSTAQQVLEIGDTVRPADPLDEDLCTHLNAFRSQAE